VSTIYGGVAFGGDAKTSGPASLIIALTGPDAIIQKFKEKSFT
jgi:hypothetical protein